MNTKLLHLNGATGLEINGKTYAEGFTFFYVQVYRDENVVEN